MKNNLIIRALWACKWHIIAATFFFFLMGFAAKTPNAQLMLLLKAFLTALAFFIIGFIFAYLKNKYEN